MARRRGAAWLALTAGGAALVWGTAARAAGVPAQDRVAPQAQAAPLLRGSLHRFCVASLGDTVAAKAAQNLLLAALVQSGELTLTDSCDQADAQIKGSAQLTQSSESQSESERDLGDVHGWTRTVPQQSASIELRLVESDGRIVWADAEDSNGSLSADALHDAVARIARKLLAAIGHP